MKNSIIVSVGDAQIDSAVALAAGSSITAIIIGPRSAADAAATTGVSAVQWLGDPDGLAAESWAVPVAELVADAAPDLVITGSKAAERVIGGAIAATLRAPIYTMLSSVDLSGDTTTISRAVFGGIAEETVSVTGPAVVVLDAGSGVEAGAGHTAVPVSEEVVSPSTSMTVVEQRPSGTSQAQLGKARRIVSVGRGVKAHDDLALIENLATALDADISCSRPLAEGVGWFSHDRYIGVTGQNVAPDLYLAIGISGQLQHVVGARDASTVVVVNTDDKCPYFSEADYCVVGDLYQVVPALTEALQ